MGGAVIELIPFKVELGTFEELNYDWEFYKTQQRWLSDTGFFSQMVRSSGVYAKEEEYTKKMCELYPFRKALSEVYTDWAKQFPGEWIVVGKIGSYYLATQPKKVAQMLPIECCKFVGIYNA